MEKVNLTMCLFNIVSNFIIIIIKDVLGERQKFVLDGQVSVNNGERQLFFCVDLIA